MPFETLKFRYPWRPYQERVLQALKDHLNDQRLHVVAAPGAGKTTLGLEVFRLLGKSTLVLSPTRVIRDQWISRLKDFCDIDDVTQLDWVSNSIMNPKILTSITYQALHAKFADDLDSEKDEGLLLEKDTGLKDDELNSFIKVIEENNIQVLILDEAHHLRAEWWKVLEKICDYFSDIILVSLTATPPYDSEGHEWVRYEQLCGSIDEEISVPELVKAGTLCAHQDFIWACDASVIEKNQIKEYDDRVLTLCNTLFDNKVFGEIVLSHPWLHSSEIDQEVIREPEIAIAILSFMKAKEFPDHEGLMELLDLTNADIPEIGRHWWQVLVEAMLFSKTYQHNEDQKKFVDHLKKQLKTSELLHKRELSLERSRRIERSLSLSSSKVEACNTIHKLEYEHRGESLRQVFLTDYIRDESLTSGLDTGNINLGAWPLFKSIAFSSPISDQVSLLTGRLSIIPANKLQILLNHVDKIKIKFEPLQTNKEYLIVTGPLNQLTNAFTALLVNGDIKVIIGTRSLLGEGWDAPAINSLVLASTVGSFMLTNQMRGRAIRINKNDLKKTSSIWHLVAINTKSFTGWSDYNNLKKRFETFVGLSEKELTIESGFDRMNTNVNPSYNALSEIAPITSNNRQMSHRFHKLQTISERWNSALTLDETARVIPSVKTNKTPKLRGFILKHSLSYLLVQITGIFIAVVASVFYLEPQSGSQLLLYFLAAIIGALIYTLPKTLSVIKILFLYLPIDGALKQIGQSLAEALCQAGFIDTSIRQMKVNVTKHVDGTYYLSLSGSTFYESSLFADCLTEILAPIKNPRYMILREGKFLGAMRDDYHALPMRFAVKKEYAMIFYKSWCKNVSLSELIYTRTPEGRKRLLKAKMKAFSTTFHDKVKRQDIWQ